MEKIIIILPFLARSKKNSQNIIWNKNTGKPMIIQSKSYLEFEKLCKPFVNKYSGLKINKPINLKCTFYVPDKRVRDISNYINAIQDMLVRYRVLMDDNYNIVASLDGSRIIYEKGNAQTIIEIEELKNGR